VTTWTGLTVFRNKISNINTFVYLINQVSAEELTTDRAIPRGLIVHQAHTRYRSRDCNKIVDIKFDAHDPFLE